MNRPIGNIAYEHLLLTRYAAGAAEAVTRRPLERSAYILLTRLSLDGPLSVGELGERLELDVSTVHRQTSAMLKGGLLNRIPDPDGGMARKFTASDLGNQRLSQHQQLVLSSMDRIMDEWTDVEVGEFNQYLRRFNQRVEQLRNNPWPRP